MEKKIYEVASHFLFEQGATTIAPYGNGHINDTFCVSVEAGKARPVRYILQRVNRYVFPHPENVMDNIAHVTAYLREKIAVAGGDPNRETLTLVKTREGGNYHVDEDNGLWRAYLFIEDTISRDLPDTPELFALSGAAFGRFMRQLEGYDASALHEAIKDFHNTPARYGQLMDAVRRNDAGRLGEVGPELAFCMGYGEEVHTLLRALEAGEIPLRVTHNDTKLNNVLLDAKTGEGVCVIDLDTVMPGLAAYDFGDSIRFGANTAAEDERDLSKVNFSLEMYEAFVRGYLSEAGGVMGRRERELLPMGAKLMTLECGMRFLADHLNGDKYFKVHREGHNLDRARTQFKLVRCMEENWDTMMQIVLSA